LKKPNFFLVGAPKCGTTSIAAQIGKHPEIFISNPKEPHFFEKDIDRGIRDLKTYESLFQDANSTHIIVGEASTGYLYSAGAITEALKYSPDAKFLVVLRNPYDMALSLHSHAVRGGYENQEDFNIAWGLQHQRVQGKQLPRQCLSSRLLMYANRCSIGDQLEELLNAVPDNSVHIGFFDDLKSNPNKFYKDIFRFLGVEEQETDTFENLNKRRRHRFPIVVRATRMLGRMKQRMGVGKSIGIADWIAEKLSSPDHSSRNIKEEIWLQMDDAFIPQIEKLELLCGRDLTSWKKTRM